MRALFLVAGAMVMATTALAEDVVVEKARDALMSGAYSTAVQLATNGASDATVGPLAKAKLLVIRGQALLEQSPSNITLGAADMTAAMRDLSQAIDESKTPQEVCEAKGNIFEYRAFAEVALRRFVEAVDDAEKAVLCEPNDALAQFSLGNSRYAIEETAKAIDAYTATIKLKPDFRAAYARRAQNYENLRDLEKAVSDYNEVLRLVPDDATTLNNRATALLELGRLDNALVDINKAIELEPKNFMAHLNRAAIYYSKREFGKARDDWSTGKAALDEGRSGMENAVGPKNMARYDYFFASLKEKLDDAPQ